MQRHLDYLNDTHGNGLGGVTVTVYESDGVTEASIFDKNGNAQDNPFATGDDGSYDFYAANGIYVINFSSLNVNKTVEGVQLLEYLAATGTLDFGSIAAGGYEDLTIALVGAEVGQAVALGLPAAPLAGIVFDAFVSAADVVTVRATNITGGALDPGSADYKVTVY